MREIKFRAWDKVNKEMYRVGYIDFPSKKVQLAIIQDGICYKAFEADLKDVELLQYTGLKDKNGKEIYEGDILESISGTVGNSEAKVMSIYEVVLDDRNSYSFGTRRKGRTHISSPIYRSATKYYKVIGNIYENPELLQGGNK
ncbi:hypothetical protein COL81_26900 [Bacillus toyonensis]|uniref:YopX family protein n=1 Tax=Bacillus toyonensis TaxID=155322 RepID=UPI000BF793AA|nr:YopX family protein [Bacillus toyonensis]PGA33305.1 hypothetical protein COL81_26900 [Bacillus toyonensis]